MAQSLVITADTDSIVAARNTTLKGVLLCAGSGANASVEVFDGTVSAGTSILKLAAVLATAVYVEVDILVTGGISFDMTGAGAKAYLIYE